MKKLLGIAFVGMMAFGCGSSSKNTNPDTTNATPPAAGTSTTPPPASGTDSTATPPAGGTTTPQ